MNYKKVDDILSFLENDKRKNYFDSLIKICQYIHIDCLAKAENYKKEEGRIVYVTPSLYLDLINQIQKIYLEQKTKRDNLREVKLKLYIKNKKYLL